jgi:nucleoside-diphosphate-sugar epimerase
MMQRALVTGATGFIGRQLCQTLQSKGVHVTALGRAPQDGPWDVFRSGDIAGILPLDLCDNIDVVFHLAGIAHAMKMPKSEEGCYQQINVEGTAHLLDLIRESEVKALVYFSSIKAMADPGEACVDEGFLAKPTDPYGASKREAEENVLAFGQRYGFHVSILRPTLVYGPAPKGNLARMIHAIRAERFPPLNIQSNKRSMVSVNDLISAAILVASYEQANGQVYIVSDGHSYSTRDIYLAMCRALNKEPPRWSLPIWPLSILAAAGDAIGRLRGRPFVFNSEALRRLIGSACYRNDKLRGLGWQPSQTLQDVLPQMVAGE